jgi:hypothetical protein
MGLGDPVKNFLSAFFFGFTSLPGPARLFANGSENQVNLFPTGIIPLFLVTYAITYHMLSLLHNAQKRSTNGPKRSNR